ncbi:MAG: type II toxin-antitoxin system Phd/YefM family antitoxin [Nitrospirota bacterium]
MNKLKTIQAYEARQHLGELLEEVFYKQTQIIIKRGRKPMAVVISPEEYEAYCKQREEDFRIFDEIRAQTKKVTPKTIERDVEEAVRAVRKEYVSGRP